MGICGIGSITVIILLVIFGVTGKVSGGMLALGWLWIAVFVPDMSVVMIKFPGRFMNLQCPFIVFCICR